LALRLQSTPRVGGGSAFYVRQRIMSDAISGLIGVIVGAGISFLAYSHHERRRHAFELYTEWSSTEMELYRQRAFRFLEINKKKDHPISFRELHDTGLNDDLLALEKVMHFWSKTSLLLQAGYVSQSLTRRLLSHYFKSWYNQVLCEFIELCRTRDQEPNYRVWIEEVDYLTAKYV